MSSIPDILEKLVNEFKDKYGKSNLRRNQNTIVFEPDGKTTWTIAIWDLGGGNFMAAGCEKQYTGPDLEQALKTIKEALQAGIAHITIR